LRVWSAIFNFFALVVLAILLVSYLNASKVIQRDFDQDRLNKAVEYSSEAAFRNTIEFNDIDIEYGNLNSVEVNPGETLDIFTSMMCLNYDISTSSENMRYIEDAIASMVISADDGFYILEYVNDFIDINDKSKGMDYKSRWSVKIPYLDGSGKRYSITSKLRDVVNNESEKIKILEVPNKQIADYIIAEMNYKSINDVGFDYRLYLPSVQTIGGVNPIEGPGLLIMVGELDFASSEKINSISVAGFKTEEKKYVIGVIEDTNKDGQFDSLDTKYYCYEGQMYENEINSRYKVNKYFENMQAAEDDGYVPNFELLTRKINK